MGSFPGFETWATVYTDASWHNGDSGWAARVRYGEAPERVEGSGRRLTADCNVAELIAIVEGVRLAISTWQSINGLWIRSDSETAIRWATLPFEPAEREDVCALQRDLLGMVISRRLTLSLKWVKGHAKDGSVAAFMNRRVDRLAGLARLSADGGIR